MEQGYIKLYRQMWDKGWSKHPNYVAVWVYLLKEATHEPREYFWNGKTIVLQEGEFITGRKKISEETGVNESSVERILNYFKNEQQIEQRKTTTSRLISICNWNKFQKGEQPFEQRMNNERTTNEQRMNTKQECKNVISNIYSQDCKKLVDFINQTFNKHFRVGDKIVSHYKARLTKDKVTKQEIFEVIQNLKATQYHIETGYKYCTPEFILRLTTIEKYKHGALNQTKQQTNQPDSKPNLMDDFYGD